MKFPRSTPGAARWVVGEPGRARAGIQRDGSESNELRTAQLADEDLVGSVPVAKNVGTKPPQDIGGGSDLRQRPGEEVALEIDQPGRLSWWKQQYARVVQRQDLIALEVFRQTAVSIRRLFVSAFHNLRFPSLPALATSCAGSEIARA